MISIRSSWTIKDGVVTPLGEKPRKLNSHTCACCGRPGHNARTCGQLEAFRAQRRR